MSYLLENMHFIFIHVPIAMLLFSFIFDGVAVFLKRKDWHTAGLLCLVIGTLGSIASVLTGPEEARNPLFPRHELFGKLTMFFFIALTLIRVGLLVWRKLESGRKIIYLAAAFIGVLLVTYTGHLGGQMVHPDRSQMPQMGPGGGQPGQGPSGQQGQRPQGRVGGQGAGGQPQGASGLR